MTNGSLAQIAHVRARQYVKSAAITPAEMLGFRVATHREPALLRLRASQIQGQQPISLTPRAGQIENETLAPLKQTGTQRRPPQSTIRGVLTLVRAADFS